MKAEAEVTDYATKQASKYAAKQAAKTSQIDALDLAIGFLKGEGYTIDIEGIRYRVHEPSGSWTGQISAQQLVEYAKERGFSL